MGLDADFRVLILFFEAETTGLIFKYSGRLTSPAHRADEAHHMKAAWYYAPPSKFKQAISFAGQTVFCDDFNEIIDNNLGPIHDWIPGWIDQRHTKNNWRTNYKPYTGIWSTEQGQKLEKLLTNCRSQCWDCHECERTFGFQDVDSALQMRKNFNE